jgi:hypothetical protein
MNEAPKSKDGSPILSDFARQVAQAMALSEKSAQLPLYVADIKAKIDAGLTFDGATLALQHQLAATAMQHKDKAAKKKAKSEFATTVLACLHVALDEPTRQALTGVRKGLSDAYESYKRDAVGLRKIEADVTKLEGEIATIEADDDHTNHAAMSRLAGMRISLEKAKAKAQSLTGNFEEPVETLREAMHACMSVIRPIYVEVAAEMACEIENSLLPYFTPERVSYAREAGRQTDCVQQFGFWANHRNGGDSPNSANAEVMLAQIDSLLAGSVKWSFTGATSLVKVPASIVSAESKTAK